MTNCISARRVPTIHVVERRKRSMPTVVAGAPSQVAFTACRVPAWLLHDHEWLSAKASKNGACATHGLCRLARGNLSVASTVSTVCGGIFRGNSLAHALSTREYENRFGRDMGVWLRMLIRDMVGLFNSRHAFYHGPSVPHEFQRKSRNASITTGRVVFGPL